MKTVLEIAKSYIGQKEIKGNKGFEDAEFENRMKAVGFKSGYAWCSLFAELVYISAFVDKRKELTALFSAGAVKTMKNFNRSKNWTLTEKAIPGALVCFQTFRNGKPHWTGHIGIVEKANKDNFISIEGNTNGSGGREGIEVARKTRKYNFNNKNGLVLMGFIVPKEETKKAKKSTKKSEE